MLSAAAARQAPHVHSAPSSPERQPNRTGEDTACRDGCQQGCGLQDSGWGSMGTALQCWPSGQGSRGQSGRTDAAESHRSWRRHQGRQAQ